MVEIDRGYLLPAIHRQHSAKLLHGDRSRQQAANGERRHGGLPGFVTLAIYGFISSGCEWSSSASRRRQRSWCKNHRAAGHRGRQLFLRRGTIGAERRDRIAARDRRGRTDGMAVWRDAK